MVEPLRHRQTKGAATDMFYLTPPRHISTLPFATKMGCSRHVRFTPDSDRRADMARRPKSANNGSGPFEKDEGEARRTLRHFAYVAYGLHDRPRRNEWSELGPACRNSLFWQIDPDDSGSLGQFAHGLLCLGLNVVQGASEGDGQVHAHIGVVGPYDGDRRAL